MKKLFVAALAAVCALGVSAQRASDATEFSFWDSDAAQEKVTIGLRVGMNVANIGGKNIDGFDSKIGLNGGVSVDFNLTNSFSINSGLFFTQKGAKAEDGDYEERLTANFIELPIYASYRMNFAPQSQLQIFFGPYLDYGVYGKITEKEDGEEESYSVYEGEDSFKRFQMGLGIGAGYTFHKVYVGLQYQFGLTKMFDAGDAKPKYNNFSISVGYNF